MNIRNKILELATKVGPEKTICPSEVARALSEDWRDLMDDVRDEACRLHEKGIVEITHKGEVVKDFNFKGPIRIRIRP